jgi:ankyrin repeat protein
MGFWSRILYKGNTATSDDSKTELMRLAFLGNGDNLAGYLGRTERPKLNAKDKNGWTALMFAAAKGNEYCTKILIQCRANVNAKDNGGSTALMWAAQAGNVACVKLLIAAGADVNAKDKDGRTALMGAAVPAAAILRDAGVKK